MKRRVGWIIMSVLSGLTTLAGTAAAQSPVRWLAHDMQRQRPPVVTPGKENLPVAPPSDAVVLFDGTDLSKWRDAEGQAAKWTVKDGAMISVPNSGYLHSADKFGDVQLHIEWAAPLPVVGSGQGRGNSGVFLMGLYEVQVLDSYENETYADGQAGAIYGQYPPLVNACLPPGEWQSYDIVFRRPRFIPTARWPAGADQRRAQRRGGAGQRRDLGSDGLVAKRALQEPGRQAAAVAAGPRQPGALPQHLAARAGRKLRQRTTGRAGPDPGRADRRTSYSRSPATTRPSLATSPRSSSTASNCGYT